MDAKLRSWGGGLLGVGLIAYAVYQFAGPGLTTGAILLPLVAGVVVLVVGPIAVALAGVRADEQRRFEAHGLRLDDRSWSDLVGTHESWLYGTQGQRDHGSAWTGMQIGIPVHVTSQIVFGLERDRSRSSCWLAAFDLSRYAGPDAQIPRTSPQRQADGELVWDSVGTYVLVRGIVDPENKDASLSAFLAGATAIVRQRAMSLPAADAPEA